MVKHDSSRGMIPLSRAVSSVFDEFFSNSPLANFDLPVVNFRPSVDVIEESDKVVLMADLPGIEKDEIKVIVHDGLLTIEGTRNESHEEKRKGYARTERFMGAFSRSFNLPAWIDGSKVMAEYKNGVLTVTIPKTEQAKPKEVEIKVA